MLTIKAVCFDYNGVLEEFPFFSGTTVNQELLAWFPILQNQGFKIGILSNVSAGAKKELEKKGMYAMVDAIVISGEIGFQKPDKEAFEVLFERLEVLPQETIFIDDSRTNLENAAAIGYHPILFKNNDQLKSSLQKFGIEL